MVKSKITYVNIEEVFPYADNPRNNTAEAIDKVAFSIREYGFRNPIIVNKENTILCGHTRYYAAKKLNLNEVPIIKVTDLTPKQERGFRIADNKVSEYSGWDMDVLTKELEQLQEMDFDLSLTGFEMDELDSLLETEAETEVTEDEYEVELPEEPKAKVGDILRDFSKENEIILDVFGGSGSTLIACEQLNRTCYMMELSPQYVDVIINRWEQLTGEKAVLLNT